MAQAYEYFGKYILLEKLATGGMAEVFLARAPGADGIGKFVAIKRILPQFAESPEFIDMFRDEAKIAINLTHSNIVSIQEFDIQSNQFFIVMDFVEGKNLRQILNKLKKVNQKLTIEQIVYICKETAAGLDHAHRCLDGTTGKPLNITHRDMSPQNVMTSFEGEVKIVDFGIAKAESQMETTRAGTLKGKFGYMSPEQAEGQTVDLRTDIFSLGIVLWELLANDRLFVANNEINTLRKIRDCQVPSLRKIDPNIHAELERIVMKALTRDRNLRYQTAAALHRDLNRFLNRQFPDFSPHDFAVSIKTLFADEILNNRKKFVEFARVPFRNDMGNNNNGHRTPSARQPQQQQQQDQDPDNDFGSNPSSKTSFERPEFKEQEKSQSVRAPVQTPPPPTQTQSASIPAQKSLLDEGALMRNIYETNSSQFAPDLKSVTSRRPVSNSLPTEDFETDDDFQLTRPRSLTWVLRLVMVGLFMFVGYSYFAKYYTNMMRPVIRMTDPFLAPLHTALGISGEQKLTSHSPTNPHQKNSPPAPVAAAPQVPAPAPAPVAAPEPAPVEPPRELLTSVIVTSNPSGAEVFINGKSTGMITPSRVELPAERTFDLTLRKMGYADTSRKDMDRAALAGRLAFELQKAMVGFVDIDVKPPRNVRLLVNGQPLSFDSLPLQKVAIPADSRVMIRAEDYENRTYVEKSISVGLGRQMRLLLDFRNAQPLRSRAPSQN